MTLTSIRSCIARSCRISVRRLGLGRCVAVIWSASAGAGWAIELPSGIDADLHEVLVEEIAEESWARFRFLAPEIDRTLPDAPGFAVLEQDFPHLCRTVSLPYLETHALEADKIVISLADRAVAFGVTDPDATQYFEQFRVADGACIWEAF